MIILCVTDLPYRPTYKFVSKHRVLRTLNQNHILKVVDMLNVSQFELTDLNISVVCIFLTSFVLLDILKQVSPDLCSFNYGNSAVLHFFLIKPTDTLISQIYFCEETSLTLSWLTTFAYDILPRITRCHLCGLVSGSSELRIHSLTCICIWMHLILSFRCVSLLHMLLFAD
jgi:hypothetical protein